MRVHCARKCISRVLICTLLRGIRRIKGNNALISATVSVSPPTSSKSEIKINTPPDNRRPLILGLSLLVRTHTGPPLHLLTTPSLSVPHPSAYQLSWECLETHVDISGCHDDWGEGTGILWGGVQDAPEILQCPGQSYKRTVLPKMPPWP